MATRAVAAVSNNTSSSTSRGTGSAKTRSIALGQATRGVKEREIRGGGGRVSLNAGVAGRTERGGGGDEVIRLCPLRHKVTEVCTACLAR